jgi:3-carboxy-cis,cis-muconate cycloisomerase
LPSDAAFEPFDAGLLSPVTAGQDAVVSDAAFLAALVEAEVALMRASGVLARDADAPSPPSLDPSELAVDAAAGGNPVIPLVGVLRDTPGFERAHEGATSQDIVDSALMLLASRARVQLLATLDELEGALAAFAAAHRDHVAAGRTLTQHAVPTTIGLRAVVWLAGVSRAAERLRGLTLPAQLGGAAGTLASFVEALGADRASALPAAFAAELGLDAVPAPWHTTRWPVTELGDALVQLVDALGKLATDVATLSRTEVGELGEGDAGGSSAMPQKQNPTASVLIRSAALRAPQLGATLHLAAALAGDERPDGAWHAEWPTLRELLRLALGASAHACALVEGLRVDGDAVARNLAVTGGLILAERLAAATAPLSREAVAAIVRRAQRGEDLRDLLTEATDEKTASALLDSAAYTGLAGLLVDEAVRASREERP